ncbi:hypothetical protein WJX84_012226, partial [Apatococcus fuscideae]
GQCYVPEEPIHLLDRTLPMAMQQHAQKHGISLGVVEQLKICRAGAFSCPVACGVVLLGKVDLTHLQDLPPADLQKTLQAVVEQQACCAFDDVTSIHSLLDRCHKGQLPAISHHEANATGEWAEFQPEPRMAGLATLSRCQRLQFQSPKKMTWQALQQMRQRSLTLSGSPTIARQVRATRCKSSCRTGARQTSSASN